jgi:hypothetical protein
MNTVATNRRLVTVQPVTLGWILAVLVLICTVVLMLIGQIDLKVGLLICGLAVARLV